MKNQHNRQLATLLVLSTLGACAPAESIDEAADYLERGLALDLEDGIDHLNRANSQSRVEDMKREVQVKPFSDDSDANEVDVRADLIGQILNLALADQCDVKGAVLGGFVQGIFEGTAMQDGELLTAMFRGAYVGVQERPGGVFEGAYRDLAQTDGTLMGTYLAPGHHKSGPFGTFHGSWGQSNPKDEAVEGNIVGLWLGQDRPQGGVFVGYWSVCEDPGWSEKPVQQNDDKDADSANE